MKIDLKLITRLCLVAVVATGFAIPLNASLATLQETAEQEEVEEEEESVADLMRKAGQAFQSGDAEEALGYVDRALELDDEDFQLKLAKLQILGQHAGQIADTDRAAANQHYYSAAKVARQLLDDKTVMEDFGDRLGPMLGGAIYNEACSLSLDGKKEEALASLKESFMVGFNDFELAQSDSDLSNISDSDMFTEIVESARTAAVEKVMAMARKEIEEFESFDFDFELEDVKGETVSLSSYSGKVLIVDFWGTWCPPCREEIPSFIKLKNTYGEKGFDIVGINYERSSGDEAVEMIVDYIEENDMNYNCVIGNDETSDQVNVTGFPTTLFIDAKGKVRMKVVGLHPYEQLEAYVKLLMEENQGG